MKEIIRSLMLQGHLAEPGAAELIKEASIKDENFYSILLSLNPPKYITKQFILQNISEILNKIIKKNPEITEENLSFFKILNSTKEKQEAKNKEIKQKDDEDIQKTKEEQEKARILDEFKKRKIEVIQSIEVKNKKLTVDDFTKYFRARYDYLKKILQEKNLENLSSIGKLSGQRKNLSIIGMVSSKRFTKNKNLILEIEDLSGKINVLINTNKKELFEKAKDIVLDEVVALTGIGDSEIFFANEIFFPDTFITEKKTSNEDEYALFTADWHVGHKTFLEEKILKFITWLNGEIGTDNQKELAKRVKYLFIVGDLIEGVGVYPTQESELAIKDIYEQYKKFLEFIKKIRKDVTIIICPGNHDAVRLVEPQPILEKRFVGELTDLENVFLTTNPAIVNIGKTKNFPGFNVLMYHGFSYPHYMDEVDTLRMSNAKLKPDMIMHFLLKKRHLAPTHTSTTYFPCEKDFLLIENPPDIFVSAHTHHTAISNYNNILTISCASWIPETTYQEKLGLVADPYKVPIFHFKTGKISMLDFS